MLETIKKYAPKSYEALLKIITTKINAEQKIKDYELKIKDFDTELVSLEAESCKNPSNTKITDKLEELSAKRYGLMFRYESLKNGTSNLFTKNDIDKIVDVYKKEYSEKLTKKVNENALRYRSLRKEFDDKVSKLEKELDEKIEVMHLEDCEINATIDSLSQTMTKYYKQANLPVEEIAKIIKSNNLPFKAGTDKAI
jgi:hypothetical protein